MYHPFLLTWLLKQVLYVGLHTLYFKDFVIKLCLAACQEKEVLF